MQECEFCGAQLFSFENSATCCNSGRRVLPRVARCVPDWAQSFFARYYTVLKLHGRSVNQLSSCAVIGVRSLAQRRPGITEGNVEAFCTIEGRSYHYSLGGPLDRPGHPLLGAARSFLYSDATPEEYNGDDVDRQRFPPVVVECAMEFRRLLRQHNAFIRRMISDHGTSDMAYPTFLVQFARPGNTAATAATGEQSLTMLFRRGSNRTSRDESVAAAVSANGNIHHEFTIRDAYWECTAFPLLDPQGVRGWGMNPLDEAADDEGPQETQGAVDFEPIDIGGVRDTSLTKYARACVFQVKAMRLAPRVAQEWALDIASRSDQIRYEYLERFAPNRSATAEAVSAAAPSPPNDLIGGLYRVPSQIRGSVAWKRERVASCLSLVARYGPPHVFCTFTCNTEWPDIKTALPRGHKWHGHPDLLCRVFREKLDRLLSDVTDGTVFGYPAQWWTYAVEFQVRGVPHAHILVSFEGVNDPTADQVNLWTQTLSTTADVEINELVNKFMRHGHYDARCWRKNVPGSAVCDQRFPRVPHENSHINDANGYWEYKRRPEDSMIVAYNPILLFRYQAHINVEVAARKASIGYVFKYISKIAESINARLVAAGVPNPAALDTCEQTRAFFLSRIMCSAEALWSILGYPFWKTYPTTQGYSVHLPKQQLVTFRGTTASAQQRLASTMSDVLKYFHRPLDVEFDQLLMADYFATYAVTRRTGLCTWRDEDGRIIRRRDVPVHAFLRSVSARNKELFAVYLLLKQVYARSFAELKGDCNTFLEAAVKLRAVDEGPQGYWTAVLVEAYDRGCTPADIRNLFVIAFSTGEADCTELLRENWPLMSDAHLLGEDAMIDTIRRLQGLFAREMIDIEMVVNLHALDIARSDLAATEQLVDEYFSSCPEAMPLNELSDEQRLAVAKLTALEAPQLCMLNGAAGSGKTTTLNAVVKSLYAFGVKVACAAFTGIAASLLWRGTTVHRLFAIPSDDEVYDDDDESPVSKLKPGTLAAEIVRNTDVFIVDEISMLHSRFIGTINEALRMIVGVDAPFAGKRSGCAERRRMFGRMGSYVDISYRDQRQVP